MFRKLMFLSTIAMTLAVAVPASATPPIREVNPSQADRVITDQCAFPVLGHIEGPEIIMMFFDAAGDPVKGIVAYPGHRITLTNVNTGTSLTILGTGSSQVRPEPDGSLSLRSMGHGPFFPNPLTGEPGIWYLSGQGRSTLDSDGNLMSATLHGRLVDLCPRLAG
jgi:hypothetical protein